MMTNAMHCTVSAKVASLLNLTVVRTSRRSAETQKQNNETYVSPLVYNIAAVVGLGETLRSQKPAASRFIRPLYKSTI